MLIFREGHPPAKPTDSRLLSKCLAKRFFSASREGEQLQLGMVSISQMGKSELLQELRVTANSVSQTATTKSIAKTAGSVIWEDHYPALRRNQQKQKVTLIQKKINLNLA